MYIDKNDWLVKFDIHSAYHHIEMYPQHTNYLGFSWIWPEGKKYYKFLVLPFGLTSAPYVFTKVTRQLVKLWRHDGLRIVMFLDDGLLVESLESECSISAMKAKTQAYAP